MSNRIKKIDCSPDDFPSGKETTVAVEYEADDDGPLVVVPSDGYETDPEQQPLQRGKTSDSFKLKVSGPPGDCVLTFTFFGTPTPIMVTIR